MEGISKERLEVLCKKYSFIGFLLKECEELDPWLPIADAPKDRPIWLFNGVKCLAQWDDCLDSWSVLPVFWGGTTLDSSKPFTHYKELPPDPEE